MAKIKVRNLRQNQTYTTFFCSWRTLEQKLKEVDLIKDKEILIKIESTEEGLYYSLAGGED